MTYEIRGRGMARHMGADGVDYDARGKRSRKWYEAEFRRLAGLRDIHTAYALLQEARADHGDVWACLAHLNAFKRIMMDDD